MWSKRLKESFAILTIGDGVMEIVAPREHSRLWETGPETGRKAARFFAENPNLIRLLGISQVAFGVWLALRQYRDEE
jgi:hypothetical protein